MNKESLKINESLRKHLREIRGIIRNECELRMAQIEEIEDAVKSMEELIERNK